MNFRTKLSNAFATMATIGAQANGATVGEDATALSRWNVGLTDRIIEKRVGAGPEITETTDIKETYIHNVAAFQNIINKTNDATLSDAEIAAARNAATDVFKTEISSHALKNQNNRSQGMTPLGFIPFDLELNMMGLSGPRIYESYTIDTKLLPNSYKDSIQFICSGISHTISDGEWKTTLNSICGPRQEGSTVTGMKKADPAKSSSPPSRPRSGGCNALRDAEIAAIRDIDTVLKANGFETVESRIGILAVIGKETGYHPRREDSYAGSDNDYILNGRGLFSGFGSRKRFGKKLSDLTGPELTTLKNNPEDFFNWIYDGESTSLGNINGSDDGWKYRASGYNQITGRANYQGITDFTGIDYIANPDLLNEPAGAAAGAAWYFGKNNARTVTGLHGRTGGSGDYRTTTNIDAAVKAAAWQNAGADYSITEDTVVNSMNNAMNCKDTLINLYRTDAELQSRYHYS
jgi:predicted chitinase